jgi:hypothetical protein
MMTRGYKNARGSEPLRRSRPPLGLSLLTLLVIAMALAASLPASATSKAAATRLAPGTTFEGRFVKSFELDGGTFRVTPAPASMGTREVPHSIEIEARATSQVEGYTVEGIGFGVVTVEKKYKGVRQVRYQPAWVGLVYENQINDLNCGVMTVPKDPKKLIPPTSSGWAAVVLGWGRTPPDVVYTARDLNGCGDLLPASLVNASEMISLPWRDDNGGALVEMPACATVYMVASGTSRSAPPDLNIWVTRGDDPTAPGCTPAHPSDVVDSNSAVAGNPDTTHDPVGPVRMVNPGAE